MDITGNESSWEWILLRMKGPGNESSREQEGQGAKVPGSELARVLLADLLLGCQTPPMSYVVCCASRFWVMLVITVYRHTSTFCLTGNCTLHLLDSLSHFAYKTVHFTYRTVCLLNFVWCLLTWNKLFFRGKVSLKYLLHDTFIVRPIPASGTLCQLIPLVLILCRYRRNAPIPAPILRTHHVRVTKTIVLCFDCVPRCCSLCVKTLSTWNSSLLHY